MPKLKLKNASQTLVRAAITPARGLSDGNTNMSEKISQDYCVISGAYGKDYKKGQDAIDAFMAGKDFEMHTPGMGGTFCSVRDFEKGTTVSIRYKSLRSVINHTIPVSK